MAPQSSPSREGGSLPTLWEKMEMATLVIWSRTTRRVRLAGAGILLLCFVVLLAPRPDIHSMELPKASLEYHAPAPRPYNESKVALLIENRANPILAPLMLHFMSVVPPEWRFRFMGSPESVAHINGSVAIREQVRAGKLDLTLIPANMSTAGTEQISRFLTTLWLYEVVLQPAEWLLVFQTDSILCANSRRNLNDYLDYDWVGAPWNPWGQWGGNGGLSLRRVSAMIAVLRDQVRIDGSEPEDVWLSERLAHRPGARMANGTVALTFSGEMNAGERETVDHAHEADADRWGSGTLDAARHGDYVSGLDDWREGHYEPMGYHTGGTGSVLHGGIWGRPEARKHIWDYCPEVKMTLKMDAARFVPGNCHESWKRSDDDDDDDDDVDLASGTETIDGTEYPMLPPDLLPW